MWGRYGFVLRPASLYISALHNSVSVLFEVVDRPRADDERVGRQDACVTPLLRCYTSYDNYDMCTGQFVVKGVQYIYFFFQIIYSSRDFGQLGNIEPNEHFSLNK